MKHHLLLSCTLVVGARITLHGCFCVNSTPHRAHLSRATRACFSCARGSSSGAQLWTGSLDCLFLRVLNVIPSHPCFTAPCLTHSLSSHFSTPFLHLHLVRLHLFRCYIPRRVPSTDPLQGGLCLGRLAEQSPLTFWCQYSRPTQITIFFLGAHHVQLDTFFERVQRTIFFVMERYCRWFKRWLDKCFHAIATRTT